jgi:hypothetical protein
MKTVGHFNAGAPRQRQPGGIGWPTVLIAHYPRRCWRLLRSLIALPSAPTNPILAKSSQNA